MKNIKNCSNCGFVRECSQKKTQAICEQWLEQSTKPMIYVASALKGQLDELLLNVPKEHQAVFVKSYMEGNLRKAERYTRLALDSGVIPITPHLYFSHILNDTILEERRFGMDIGISWLLKCEALWVFGSLSVGMKTEIKTALDHDIPVFLINTDQSSDRMIAEKKIKLKINTIQSASQPKVKNLKVTNISRQSEPLDLPSDLCYFPEELKQVKNLKITN